MAASHDEHPAGETWSSSPRAPPHGSARSPAAASETSTPPSGSGPCAVRPHPRPGGLTDKGNKSKRARKVPIVEEIRPLVAQRILSAGPHPDARLFTGPRGGRISTAVLRDPSHRDDVVTRLGYEHLRRHGLRHTALTWLADAGVQVHVLRRIAGHGSLTTTQRYLHPDIHKITAAGAALSAHFSALPSPIVMTR
ncbi:tyrosine-type recombinase/integrase [Streptomyces sp. TSRI0395]|uniref:tyrosine-type recombinase/integrase n=1 Tax=Streptomyces sp. TSRI0395 TaxID=1703923 RepID=UPI000B2EFDF2|nr:tyrosine-type recombinase/integrase [Streptomyces sp. TSRI0395]